MDIATYLANDATALIRRVNEKSITSAELLNHSFTRLDHVNPGLNAVVRERRAAAAAEAEAIKPDTGALSGLPILLKDLSQQVTGETISSGSRLLKNVTADDDAHFVRRLRAAGAIPTGHTNTPEFGVKNITEPLLHGAARNPWNTEHSPGGSSGGAAAAVAAGIVPVAGASDGGGSIRIPASFTGLVGMKPTRGRTPVGPGAGRQWQGAAVGFVLSRTVRDSALFMDVLQTVEPHAAFQTPLLPERCTAEAGRPFGKPLRAAFSVASPVGTSVSEEAVAAVKNAAVWLEAEGHDVEEAAPAIDGNELMKGYYLMNSGEMSGLRQQLERAFGRELTAADIELEPRLLSEAGRKIGAADYTLSLQSWDAAAETMAAFHETYDLYLTPATAWTAPLVGELTASAERAAELEAGFSELSSAAQLARIEEMFRPSLTYTPFTQLANLTGQPAVSLPLHIAADGLPLGVQIIAAKGREDLLYRLAFQFEQSPLWQAAEPSAF
ncbi:amidase family protein [Salisediminibacterium halotolerans]|uniref:amidase family protein n=1 Tax=Salisediminibacterium halotolerans TaxID=517425 RepID=UPI000EB15F76|nr:amidase family protein [Salisediminibacterium halotolerans]